MPRKPVQAYEILAMIADHLAVLERILTNMKTIIFTEPPPTDYQRIRASGRTVKARRTHDGLAVDVLASRRVLQSADVPWSLRLTISEVNAKIRAGTYRRGSALDRAMKLAVEIAESKVQ